MSRLRRWLRFERASVFNDRRPIGPEQAWDAGAAERRIRQATGAEDAPNRRYASCFLWYDGEAPDEDGDGVPDRFSDYKLLVCDVVDGEIAIMPQALRAAASRLPQADIPQADREEVERLLERLKDRAGIGGVERVRRAVAEVEAAYLDYAREYMREHGYEDYQPSRYELERVGETASGVLWKAEDPILGCVYILDTGSSAEVFLAKSRDGGEIRAREDIGRAVDPSELGERTEEAILAWLNRRAKPYRVVKQEEEKRYTLGVAYPVDELDSHGDYTDASELEEAAWRFMRQVIAKGRPGAGTDHAEGTEGAAQVVESYIYRGPDWLDEEGNLIAKAGDWLVGAVWSEEAWQRVKRGELTGWSIQGLASREEVEAPDGA
jgi:hypothetical protein